MTDSDSKRWTVRAGHTGTVHIVRYWTVLRDGEEIDTYDDESLARGYVDYMNAREANR